MHGASLYIAEHSKQLIQARTVNVIKHIRSTKVHTIPLSTSHSWQYPKPSKHC